MPNARDHLGAINQRKRPISWENAFMEAPQVNRDVVRWSKHLDLTRNFRSIEVNAQSFILF